MSFTPTQEMLFNLFSILAIGYMIGDVLEMRIARIERSENSIIILLIVIVAVLIGGVYLGQTSRDLVTPFQPILYQVISFIVGLILGVYKERVSGRRR